MPAYDRKFFDRELSTSKASAAVMVPEILKLLKPQSVVDVGCGKGAWLREFQRRGVSDILGIDRGWVGDATLAIPKNRFYACDITKPLTLNRRFGLVLSLEVGEHLPKSAAKAYVKNLVSLGDVVVFSAAIPHQGGANHVNEQWQEYWAGLFAHNGYVPVDCIRKRVWNSKKISWWYAQNTIVYVKRGALAKYPRLEKEYKSTNPTALSVVHPRAYTANIKIYVALLKVLRTIPQPIRGHIENVLSGLRND